MRSGTKLKSGKMYWTKSGQGEPILFNNGFDLETKATVPITPYLTHTRDVWRAGGVSRHIKDIFIKKPIEP